ncbi:CDP-alcohol phosphatidyltransferase family protein [Halopenitus sp. H-Gu1]|uniref:CDP-alcohol phosphatidyltransferase family protein n=1 Tax=Halopenitus sp. H-Gu1 TaxID=3242697 RepID=UPI00359EAEBA
MAPRAFDITVGEDADERTCEAVRSRRFHAIGATHAALTAAGSLIVISSLGIAGEMGPSLTAFFGGMAVTLVGAVFLGHRLLVSVRSAVGPQSATLATLVTAIRASALAPLAGLAVVTVFVDPTAGSGRWIPAILFGVVAGLDAVDGAIARATDSVTALGARLDTETDALGILVGSVLVVRYEAAVAAFLAVGGARYLFVAGKRARSRRGLTLHDLAESQVRRGLAGAAMASIWIALVPVIDPRLARVITTVVMVPFLIHFLRDWLVVSGRLG